MADYWSQAQLDPAYIAAHGGYAAQLKQLLLGYGDSNALSPEVEKQYGIQPGDISAANTNPYSTMANLSQQLSGDRYGITNNAVAHGAEFSGAHAAQQAHETQNAGQRSYNALQALQQQIAGIGQQDTAALTGAYQNISNAALNAPPPPVDPAVQANIDQYNIRQMLGPETPATPAAAPPVNQSDFASSFNTTAPQNIGAGYAPIKPPKPPKAPTIKQATGYQGHA
jgi:hypothetical protein